MMRVAGLAFLLTFGAVRLTAVESIVDLVFKVFE